MVDITRQVAAEKENVEKALGNLRDAMGRREKPVVELAAIATFIHNIYKGKLFVVEVHKIRIQE